MRQDLDQVTAVEQLDAEWATNEAVYYWRLRDHYKVVEQYLHGSVLDIGCGPGYLAARTFPNEAWYTGIDISPKAIEIAKKLFPGAEFLVHDAEHYPLPFKDGSFDTIVASELFEHLQKHELLLSEIRRVARTYIVVTVPVSMGGVGHVWPVWTYQDVVDKFGCLGTFLEMRRFYGDSHKFTLAWLHARGTPTKEALLR